ncbi:hypothetical protein ACRAWD_22650 [Caulobacter segnis]
MTTTSTVSTSGSTSYLTGTISGLDTGLADRGGGDPENRAPTRWTPRSRPTRPRSAPTSRCSRC